jgi:hydrogenase maturation protein HypF
MKCVNQNPLFIRRARGYVPYPQKVPDRFQTDRHILALGGELKDTISIHKNGYIITSQFLGDLDEYQNFQYFEETIHHLTRLFEVKPDLIVSDLHPDFHTTRYAERSGLPHLRVQHHFAHILAALLEHNHPPEKIVLGISLDGYGYGADGTAWGGEFLLADFRGFVRYAHFEPVPLPGGDLASKQPWRMALSYLHHVFQDDIPSIRAFEPLEQSKIKGVIEMIKKDVNSPRTSSCGRLFDAVSFLAGTAPTEVEFEAEAPMRLESLADKKITESYKVSSFSDEKTRIVSFRDMIREIVADLRSQIPAGVISSKFHNTLAHTLVRVAENARREQKVETVILTGGVFLNGKLLSRTEELLKKKGFTVLRPVQYSPNDESISVGQIAFALSRIMDHSDDPNLI